MRIVVQRQLLRLKVPIDCGLITVVNLSMADRHGLASRITQLLDRVEVQVNSVEVSPGIPNNLFSREGEIVSCATEFKSFGFES